MNKYIDRYNYTTSVTNVQTSSCIMKKSYHEIRDFLLTKKAFHVLFSGSEKGLGSQYHGLDLLACVAWFIDGSLNLQVRKNTSLMKRLSLSSTFLRIHLPVRSSTTCVMMLLMIMMIKMQLFLLCMMLLSMMMMMMMMMMMDMSSGGRNPWIMSNRYDTLIRCRAFELRYYLPWILVSWLLFITGLATNQ